MCGIKNFNEDLKGKHCGPYVLNDENCRKIALAWLHVKAYDKDLTATTFANLKLLLNSHLPLGFP